MWPLMHKELVGLRNWMQNARKRISKSKKHREVKANGRCKLPMVKPDTSCKTTDQNGIHGKIYRQFFLATTQFKGINTWLIRLCWQSNLEVTRQTTPTGTTQARFTKHMFWSIDRTMKALMKHQLLLSEAKQWNLNSYHTEGNNRQSHR